MYFLCSLVVFLQMRVLWWLHFLQWPLLLPFQSLGPLTQPFSFCRNDMTLFKKWPLASFPPQSSTPHPDGHLWLVSEGNTVTAQSKTPLGVSALTSWDNCHWFLSFDAEGFCQPSEQYAFQLQGTHIKSSGGPLKPVLAGLEGRREGEHCRTEVELSIWQ